jgi:hypothetical protein
MTITAETSCAADVAWVEQLVAESTKLQETRPELYTLSGRLWVKAEGALREAHALAGRGRWLDPAVACSRPGPPARGVGRTCVRRGHR